MFTFNHKNRYCFPVKFVIVIEDDLLQQSRFANHLLGLFGHQSGVVVVMLPTAIDAWAWVKGKSDFMTGNNDFIVKFAQPDLIILDHDLQHGDGYEFLTEFRKAGLTTTVITASEVKNNNDRMMSAGADFNFIKNDIIDGLADEVILNAVGEFAKCPSY